MDTLPLKPFREMTADDYAAIGLKCGLEVHQQLLTRRKLFCRCPAGRYSTEYDAEVLRHMRPTLSEMGEYDGTALMEKKTRKNITYRLHHETVCTYEFDDTPPFPIADAAVDIALELALLLRLNLVNELHIARKQYLDGSIPAGFQRTTILGVDGFLPYKDRTVRVRQLGLEEDSCREVSDRGHERVYLTDRLGMPLIEVVTEPDMTTPQECAEVCDLVRKLCRSTQKVRRGAGATRQDVNVSVAGGTRIEIKGVPQIWRIPRLIHSEASRQVALLRIREELHRRGVTPGTIRVEAADVTKLVEKVAYLPVAEAIRAGHCVKCVRLGGFGGLLNVMTQARTTFAKEFSDRVRVIACLTQLPNIVHSDAASDSLLAQDWKKLRRRMGAKADDALIVVWGGEEDTRTACEEIEIRAQEATVGVPSDTRQPMKDGTNAFERVLPGAERMYPDTDLPPIAIRPERVARARALVPEFVWDTEARYRTGGMVEDDVQTLCISPRSRSITRAIEEHAMPARMLGVFVAQRFRAFAREGLRPERLSSAALDALLDAHAARRITREGLPWLVERVLHATTAESIPASAVATLLDQLAGRAVTEPGVVDRIDRAIAASDAGRFKIRAQHARWLLGPLMRELVGLVDGKRVRELLEDRLAAAGRAAAPEEVEA